MLLRRMKARVENGKRFCILIVSFSSPVQSSALLPERVVVGVLAFSEVACSAWCVKFGKVLNMTKKKHKAH